MSYNGLMDGWHGDENEIRDAQMNHLIERYNQNLDDCDDEEGNWEYIPIYIDTPAPKHDAKKLEAALEQVYKFSKIGGNNV